MSQSRCATLEDLEQAERDGRNVYLSCQCGATYSGHVGDYFWARPGHKFRCCCSRGRPGLKVVDR